MTHSQINLVSFISDLSSGPSTSSPPMRVSASASSPSSPPMRVSALMRPQPTEGESTNDVSVAAEVTMRLGKLDYYFTVLRLEDEACRLRILCDVAGDQEAYEPLSDMFRLATR